MTSYCNGDNGRWIRRWIFEYSLHKLRATEAKCVLFFIILWHIFCAGTWFVFSASVWNVLQLSLRNLGDAVVDLLQWGTFVIFIYNKNVQLRSGAFCFTLQYPFFSLRSSSSFLHLLYLTILPCIFLPITCFRRQFLSKIWWIQVFFLLFVICGMFLSPWTL